ncbi:putative kinetochore protein nuf2 [Smittium mucronatum]|uniref:Putative kinetochore protein nuf2 n=1 Tax=Smittium mucronatum TaxID=133383 RepID=A0A1R0GS75_9FUNG|nr:putative kinetochore protein nuf2 [Smittium mucronatum]
MRQMGISINEEDIQRPNPICVKVWFEAFLELLKGIFIEGMNDTLEDQITKVSQFPETHGEDAVFTCFYKQVRTMLQEIGVKDFSYADILRPEPQRTRRFLGEACNFAMFRDERIHIIEKYTGKEESLIQKNELLNQQIQATRAKIEEIKLHQEEESKRVELKRASNGSLRAQIFELKAKTDILKSQQENLKAKRLELEEINKSKETSKTAKDQQLNGLKSRIVHSPEKLQQAIDELNHSISTILATISEKSNYSNKLNSRLESFDIIANELNKRHDQLSEILAIQLKNKENLKLYLQSKESNLAINRDINDMNTVKLQTSDKIAYYQENINQLEQRKIEKNISIETKIKQLKKTKAAYEDRLAQANQNAANLRKMAADFDFQISEIKKNVSNNASDINGHYSLLIKTVMSYQQGILMIIAQYISQLQD